MAILDNKISTTEVAQNHVQGVVGDRLTGTVQENKAVFDKLPEVIVYHFNVLVDDVDALNGRLTIATTRLDLIDSNAEISENVETIFEGLGWTNPVGSNG